MQERDIFIEALQRKTPAERFRRALAADPGNSMSHYNLADTSLTWATTPTRARAFSLGSRMIWASVSIASTARDKVTIAAVRAEDAPGIVEKFRGFRRAHFAFEGVRDHLNEDAEGRIRRDRHHWWHDCSRSVAVRQSRAETFPRFYPEVLRGGSERAAGVDALLLIHFAMT